MDSDSDYKRTYNYDGHVETPTSVNVQDYGDNPSTDSLLEDILTTTSPPTE